MFNIGDTITYGASGVYKINDITDIKFGKDMQKYYILRSVSNDNSTVYVPFDNKSLTSKMRCVLSAEKIHELIRSMPERSGDWVENEAERKEVYREILASGDRGRLISMIKALYLHEKQQKAKNRRLHVLDERFFRDAEKLLYDEFALVLGIKREEVLPFIAKVIEESK